MLNELTELLEGPRPRQPTRNPDPDGRPAPRQMGRPELNHRTVEVWHRITAERAVDLAHRA